MKHVSFIDTNPNILGGTPVIAGTRIPASRIVYQLQQGYSIEQIQEVYPQLSKQTIIGVIGTIAESAERGIFFNSNS
ncbi:MAG: hypothetical protein ACD_48C00146G0001 [uncultured bacterium]|uniref:Antitoxin n=1 Tax=Candidatus Roizmanbacteria bacterium RIFCSPLOWO2_01_FULL_45_11 TaxID=1802070 RepID=A0A1F7JI68_9BACT|nr:MAG: hypothetical protein ACD_48C00146G0001 [uncultured bacterium]OGK55302.1 MAG: hypothetical protein A3B56_01955 [Candidatus Roizmanbacteria bacterium RIFCSPLOWO2_01_FULL_45_11]